MTLHIELQLLGIAEMKCEHQHAIKGRGFGSDMLGLKFTLLREIKPFLVPTGY